jgi:lyso-ornithine lipid O-acyltransferase
MNLRAARRAVTLGVALAICIFHYWLIRLRGPFTLEKRALWLHAASRRVLASLGIHYTVEGHLPDRGILVANHLSYLDIAVFSAVAPCFFVAKSEIRGWPYFGKAARVGGTLFIDRRSLASAEQVASQIGERLELQIPLLFFPEGTSSDGSAVLPFHSRLFEPAIRADAPVTAAAIRYDLANPAEERDICWFGDDAFLSHLWKTLGMKSVTATVRFGEPRKYQHRRTAAERTRAEIAEMRSGTSPIEQLERSLVH